ncbi:MAG: hypothetical protein ACP5RT_00225 [Candidatus Micrarchaeia archaeon]
MYLELPEGKIALDVRDKNTDITFISHAHFDHMQGVKSKNIIASDETRKLIRVRKGAEVETKEYAFAKLLDSGHILGSKQLYIETSLGYSIIYTGDYQLQHSCTAKPIAIRKTDMVVIDSTYPYMNVKFEEREEVEEAIIKYIKMKLEKGTIIFNSYALGKAQELIKIMNKIGIVPVVDKKIGEINKVYKEFGIDIEYGSTYEDEEKFNEITKRNFVGIVSSGNVKELARKLEKIYNKKVFTAVATGFSKIFRFDTDVQFPLSDHADIYQASEFLDMTEAKIVYTYGKESIPMAINLTKMGHKAQPFSEARLMLEKEKL